MNSKASSSLFASATRVARRSPVVSSSNLARAFSASRQRGNSNTVKPVSEAASTNTARNLLLAIAAVSIGTNLYLGTRKTNAPSVSPSPSPNGYAYKDPQLRYQYGSKEDFLKAIEEIKTYFANATGEPWDDHVSLDEDEIERRGTDENGHMGSSEGTKPSVIAYVRDTPDVQAVIKIANKYKMPIIPYSGGTSLEGHFVAPHAGISLDMSRMDKVIAFHPDDGDMVVQAGIGWETINQYCSDQGSALFFPLDPGPGATIGGMIGTGCSGTNAVRYGTARGEHFLDIKVVLPNGEIMQTRGGGRARKSSAGFDIGKIIVGAEGTLGIVTEATIRLAPKQPSSAVAVASFPNVEKASRAVNEILLKGVPVQCIELLDLEMMRQINASNLCGRTYDEKDSLFFKLSGGEAAVEEAKQSIIDAATKFGSHASSIEFETDVAKGVKIWEGRKAALWAMMANHDADGMKIWTTDVCVPISALPQLIRESQADFEASGVKGTAIVAHAGDGNFHAFLPTPTKDPAELQNCHEVVARLCERAQKLEGTCTGEHGVGLGKIEFLRNELPDSTIRLMKAIKLAFDPHNLLNPGKLYPQD